MVPGRSVNWCMRIGNSGYFTNKLHAMIFAESFPGYGNRCEQPCLTPRVM